jgi:hypothetical protein
MRALLIEPMLRKAHTVRVGIAMESTPKYRRIPLANVSHTLTRLVAPQLYVGKYHLKGKLLRIQGLEFRNRPMSKIRDSGFRVEGSTGVPQGEGQRNQGVGLRSRDLGID